MSTGYKKSYLPSNPTRKVARRGKGKKPLTANQFEHLSAENAEHRLAQMTPRERDELTEGF